MPSQIGTKWKARVTRNVAGKAHEYTQVCLTKKEALEWEANKRRELRQTQETPIVMGFEQCYNEYLDHIKPDVTVNVYKEKCKLMADVLAFIGQDVPFPDVNPKVVSKYLTHIAETISNNRSNRDHKNLTAFFTWAGKVYAAPNPVVFKKLTHEVGEKFLPSQQDIDKLRLAAKSIERPFLYCYLYTGARVREIFRLKWSDINIEKKMMRLWSRKNTARVLKPTWLEIPDVLLNQLTWWYKTPERLFKESEYVFVIQHRKHAGQPYKERRWFMKSLCKRASVKYFPLGDMRPIVASHLYDKGKPTKTIQGQLRHARPSTTDRYLKTITGSNPGMGDTLENLWDTPGTEYDSEYDFPLEEG